MRHHEAKDLVERMREHGASVEMYNTGKRDEHGHVVWSVRMKKRAEEDSLTLGADRWEQEERTP